MTVSNLAAYRGGRGNRKSDLAKLADKIQAGDGCWEWLGAKLPSGYGRLAWRGGNDGGPVSWWLAHRASYTHFIGPIPEGMTLDHYRLNPGPRQAPCSRSCVRPAHLEPVTMRENVLRGTAITAKNARKTHCLNGHELSGDNLSLVMGARGRLTRRCIVCVNARQRKYNGKCATQEAP